MKTAKYLLTWICRDKEPLDPPETEPDFTIISLTDTDNQNIVVSSGEENICDQEQFQEKMKNAAYSSI